MVLLLEQFNVFVWVPHQDAVLRGYAFSLMCDNLDDDSSRMACLWRILSDRLGSERQRDYIHIEAVMGPGSHYGPISWPIWDHIGTHSLLDPMVSDKQTNKKPPYIYIYIQRERKILRISPKAIS
jgi:hypothetical protein